MIEFSPVWVSSPHHLQSYLQLCKQSSWSQRLLGIYPVDTFPHVAMGTGNLRFGRVPVPYFAHGKLAMRDDTLSFVAEEPPTRIVQMNLHADLQFLLPRESILKVDRLRHADLLTTHFDIDWIHISAQSSPIGGDVLVHGARTRGPFLKQSTTLTESLYQALLQFVG